MFDALRKLTKLVHPRDRRKVLMIALLMIVSALVQTAGIASVMPFLAVLADPQLVQSNPQLNWTFKFLGFNSEDAFLFFLGFAAFLLFIIGTALRALTTWTITRFSHLQVYELSRRLMADYLRRPYTFFLNRNSGDLTKNILAETNHVITGFLMPLMNLASQGLLVLLIIALLISVEPKLAIIIALVLGIIYGAIYMVAQAWLYRSGTDRVESNRQRFTAASEAFAGVKEIRLLGRERDYLERYREPSKRYAMHMANLGLLKSMPNYAIEGIAFGGVLVLVLFLMAGDRGLAHALPLIGLYALAGRRLIPGFQGIFGTATQLRFNYPAVGEMLAELNRPDDTVAFINHSRGDASPMTPRKSIRMIGITYRYPGFEGAAIQHMSLEIAVNTTVGVIGSSGAGKSTVVDLLLGLLTPESGEIRVDDVRLGRSNHRNWQAAIGYVPQHIFLADQSVAANVALGLPEDQIDWPAVERASRLANLHDFVTQELPDGYGTIIGERGTRLSGGQRQRIGIARALYKDPAILFFDEATSALDNATEQVVMEAIHNLSGHKTIILVAHRLSTVKDCARIYVLDRGRVAAYGTWDELQKSSRDFKKLSAAGV